MRSREFTSNPIAGIRRIFHGDDEGNFTIETRQDVGALIERNKAIMSLKGYGASRKFGGPQSFHHVRSIPSSIYYKLKREGILGEGEGEAAVLDEKKFQKWLNDSDNAAWRTHEGKI